MKQIIFTFVLCLGLVVSYGQVKVHQDGKTVAGNNSFTPVETFTVDGSSSVEGFMRVGKGVGAAGAKIEFGEGRTADGPATIDLVSDASNYPDFGVRFARFAAGDSQFQHRGSQPFVFNAVDGATIFFQTSGTNRMFVNSTGLLPGNNNVHSLGSSSNRWTEVWAANGTIQTSDERTKQNIDDSPYGLAEIMELRPVTFEWKDSPEYGQKVGLIAQEVQPIIKEVVRTQTVRVTKEGQRTLEDTELMGLNYAELVPILVKAIQEQQVVIENQKLELDELKAKFAIVDQLANELQDLKDKLGNTEIIHLGEVITKQEVELRDLASVNQNQPNPFNQNTSISYYLPEEVSRATLVISDINGRILKEVILEGRGKGILETKAGELQSGTYTYSLVVDGKIVDTKKMILTK